MDINQHFGKRVRQQRLQAGMSQEDLADKADLHRTYISDVERASRNVTLKSAARIAEALGRRLSELLEVSD